jgi:hypothetical protein
MARAAACLAAVTLSIEQLVDECRFLWEEWQMDPSAVK